jgi:acyl dehydratase
VPLYLEDVRSGEVYRSGTVTVTETEIREFAARFDPQPFHTDPGAAQASAFGALAASGWHTAALTMRLTVESEMDPAGGVIGLGVESLRWPRPVHAGDTLTVVIKVLDWRESRSRPDAGIVRVECTTLNQRGETVQVMVPSLLVPRRPRPA